MMVYDTFRRAKVPLVEPGQEGREQVWYWCGPTVYDAAHLGHARTYVALDVMRRAACSFHNVPVRLLVGVTDVDDKIIARAGASSAADLAREQEAGFFDAMARLGVEAPAALLRVTEHIPAIVGCVEELVAAGVAYRVSEAAGAAAGVYFDVAAFEARGGRYGGLAPSLPSSAGKPAAFKRGHRDFALWKAAKPGEPSWPSPWGAGRPGWHIECSAMTLAAAGDSLDLHAGGSDLCFPHHTNEAAQSEAILAARGRGGDGPWVRVWSHPGPLTVNGTKMSKSLNNFTPAAALADPEPGSPLHAALRGASGADAFRLLALRQHYRSALAFDEASLSAAAALLLRWTRFLARAADAADAAWSGTHRRAGPSGDGQRLVHAAAGLRSRVAAALADDLDTPAVVAAVSDCVSLGLAALARDPEPLPLRAAAAAVAGVLRDLGFQAVAPVGPWPGETHRKRDTTAPADTDAVAVLEAFRAAVRDAALQGGGRGPLLALCDKLRDDVAPAMLRGHEMRDDGAGSPAFAKALAKLRGEASSQP